MNFGEAFGVSNTYSPTLTQAYGMRHLGVQPDPTDPTTAFNSRPDAEVGSYREGIAPYAYGDRNHSFGSEDFLAR